MRKLRPDHAVGPASQRTPRAAAMAAGSAGVPDIGPLLSTARALRSAALSGRPMTPLHGCNVALMFGVEHATDAALLQEAAAGLGARVVCLQPPLAALSATNPPQPAACDALVPVQQLARTLGRLYDALVCQDLPAAVLQTLRLHAGVPVLDGLHIRRHWHTALAARLAEHTVAVSSTDSDATDITADGDDGRYVLQALLLSLLSDAGR